MIEVLAFRNCLGVGRLRSEVPAGLTFRDLQESQRHPDWDRNEIISVSVAGRVISEGELDELVPDHSQVVMIPTPMITTSSLLGFLINLAISVLVAVVSKALAPKPKEQPQARDDETSPTYQIGIATEYRSGLPMPIVFGEHDVGGTAVNVHVRAAGSVPGGWPRNTEFLYLDLALCQGPIHAIGNVTEDRDLLGGFSGGPPSKGTLPSNIRVNGTALDPAQLANAGAYAWTRLGRLGSAPISESPGTLSTDLVSEDLPDKDTSAVYTVANSGGLEITTMTAVFHMPSGCYKLDANAGRQPFPLRVKVEGRPTGTAQWRDIIRDPGQDLGSFTTDRSAYTVTLPLVPTSSWPNNSFGTTGLEIRVTRLTARNEGGATNAVSACTWRQLAFGSGDKLAYPGVVRLGLLVAGNERIGGGQPNILNRIQGVPVRVWDDTVLQGLPSGQWIGGERVPTTGDDDGWYWPVIPAGSPYAGIWSHPPGKNPSWLSIEFLTNQDWGVGRFISDDMIDWPAYRNLADYCDRDVAVGSSTEVGNTLNWVLDTPTPIWEVLLRMLSAARAAPVIVGDKISCRYNYHDAHGRGTNQVPQRASTQLVNAANVEDFQITYRNPFDRPGVYILQILDEKHDFTHATVPYEDPEAKFNDPTAIETLAFTKETVDHFGVTRRSQAIRDAHFYHAANRLILSEITFVAGPDTLAATVGDVIDVQHPALKPFDNAASGWRLFQNSSGAQVYLDHEVTLSSGTQYAIAVVIFGTSGGSVQHVDVVTGTSGTFSPGQAIPLAQTINVRKGQPVVFGVKDEVTTRYEIRSITLQENLKREVQCHEYHPEVYEDHDVGNLEELEYGAATSDLDYGFPQRGNTFAETAQKSPQAVSATIEKTDVPHRHEVQFALDGTHASREARVFVRRSDERITEDFEGVPRDDRPPWQQLGHSVGGTPIETDFFVPHQRYDLAVIQPNRLGAWSLPEQGAVTEDILVDEFPGHVPPPPTHVRSERVFEGHQIFFEPPDFPGFAYVEVRETGTGAGSEHWLGARLLGRTSDRSIVVPPILGDRWVLRARSRSGLYSECVLHTPNAKEPQNEYDVGATFTGWLGTDVDVHGGGWCLSADKPAGTITADADLGYLAEARLVIAGHHYWIDEGYTLGDAIADGFTIGSGEAAWRLLGGREASPFKPGTNFELTLGEVADLPLGHPDLQDLSAGGTRGQPGERGAVRIRVNYDGAGWEDYVPRRRVFQAVEIKVELFRETLDVQTYTSTLTPKIYMR